MLKQTNNVTAPRKWNLLVLVGMLPAAAVLPLLVFAATLMFLLTLEGTSSARETLNEANRSLTRVVQSELRRAVEDLERLTLATSGSTRNPEVAARLAASLVGPGKVFSAILLDSPEKQQILAGSADLPSNAGSRQRSTRTGITNFQKTGSSSRGVVEIFTSFPAEEDTMLVGQLNLRSLATTLANHAGERSYATILDSNDIIIARSTDFEMYMGERPSQQTVDAVHRALVGNERFPTRDGRELFWSWQRLPSTDWVILLGTQAKELDAAFWNSIRQLLIGAALALSLGFFAAWWVGRRIVRAVDELTEQTPGLVSGEAASYRVSGLRQFDTLYEAMSAAGKRLKTAQLERDRALVSEQALREVAESNNKKKDVFIATLSHELRNPLAPVVAASRVLQRPDLPPHQVARAASIIDRQSRMLSHLLDDLLDVSRLTTGRVHLNRRPTLMAEVLQAAGESVRPLLTAKQHNLSLNLHPDNLSVLGDKFRLIQVTANLLNNAAKFTDPGGKIELAAVPLGARDVLLSVTDNGIGLSEESSESIFNIFEQVENERGRADGGLGIGLYLVKGLVELHGGSIRTVSEGPGKGTRFEVTLPRTLPPMNLPSTSADPEGIPLRQLKSVLIVDDNVDAATSLRALLEVSGGFEVDITHTGEDALIMVEEGNYEAICVDIGLPGMDGYEVARRLRSRTEAKLIATTGWGTFEDKRQAFAAGFDTHLIKPVDPDELMRELQI